MAVDGCFWTVPVESFQENILGGVILVYNHYSTLSSQSVIWQKEVLYHQEISENGCLLTSSYATRNVDRIPLIKIKHNFSFPSAIVEWNKLDPAIRNAESLGIFKINILKFFRPTPRSFFNCYNHKRIRLMIRPLGEWAVHMNINSITIFKTVLFLFAVVVWILNQRLTFFSLILWLLLKPGPGPWTRTLNPDPGPWTLDPEPGPWSLDPGPWTRTLDPGPWTRTLDTDPGPRPCKIWTLKNLDPERHGKQLDMEND